jgi:protein phosphatase
MGSTLACLLIRGGRACIANMGDSRVYRWRAGLTCLTQDHSLTALLVREGEISPRSAARHPARGQLTRYVGMEQEVYPDMSSVQVKIGDRFLLCTDGLWNVLPDKRIAGLPTDDAGPEAVCARLIAAAKLAGSQDDVTAVVVLVCATPSRRLTKAENDLTLL